MTRKRNLIVAAVLTLASALESGEGFAARPREVRVVGARVHFGDLVPDSDSAAAAVDLGPSPLAGCSRIVTRSDILTALAAQKVEPPSHLPDAVRVVRQAKHVLPAELDSLVRDAAKTTSLQRGVSLATVHADRPIDVVDGWTRVDVEIPHAPKKAGAFSTTAILSFFGADAEVLARVPVAIDLMVSAEGTAFDAPRGSQLTLVIRRNNVEVRIGAFAGADADVGDPVPAQLRPSGRVVHARLVDRREALALEVSP
jgi:hypothetical protein